MSYNAVANLADDPYLRRRVAACAATEGVRSPHPVTWADLNAWDLAAEPGWADAYDYAVNTGVADPGKSESVITDAMILAAVQALLNTAV